MVFDELDGTEQQHLQNHLLTCKTCSRELHELRGVHSLLSQHNHSPAPQPVFTAYTTALQKRFPTQPAWKRAANWIVSQLRELGGSQKMALRLARTVAVLLVGVFVGRLLFVPATVQNTEPEIVQTLSVEDIQFIADYFAKSELLLLTIANASLELSESDISLDVDMARTLLSKTTTVQRKATLLQDESLISFLNRLEVLLLELSNREDSEIQDAFRELREKIREAKMVQKSRQLQDQLLNTLSQST